MLDVPNSLEHLLKRLHTEGYNVGEFATDPDATGQSLVAALSILSEDSVIAAGVERMPKVIDDRMLRARHGDQTVPDTLALPRGGLGGAKIVSLYLMHEASLTIQPLIMMHYGAVHRLVKK